MMQRHEVVHHRRAQPAPLRRVPPVAEVEDVELADDALDRRPPEPAPERPERVRSRHDGQHAVEIHTGEGALDLAPAAYARRREGDDIVAARLDEAEQGAADVVADAGSRVRERRDVDDDSHPEAGPYWNAATSTPSSRGSELLSAG